MRQRRNYLFLLGLIIAALVGVALLAVPSSPAHKKSHLGLDLQGGLEVVLQAVPPKKFWYEPDRTPPRPSEGFIGIQNHKEKDTVWFKEISVRPLR